MNNYFKRSGFKPRRLSAGILIFLVTMSLVFSSLSPLNMVFAADGTTEEVTIQESYQLSSDIVPNLAKNPGFEEDINNNNWNYIIKTAPYEIDTNVYYEGTKSLKVVSESGKRATFEQDFVPIDSGSIYQLSGYVRTENWQGNANLQLFYYDANKNVLLKELRTAVIPTGTYDWMKIDVPMVEKVPGASYARLTINAINGPGTIWYDNISFKTVPLTLESITVTTNKSSLFVGRQATLTVSGKMSNGVNVDLSNADITYESEDKAIIEADSNGILTAEAPGTAKITVSVTLDGITVTNDITVHVESPENVTSTKTRPTYYTPEKIAAARENIDHYNWARGMKDIVVEQANKVVDKAEDLWNMVTPQSIPRSFTVNTDYKCPGCGIDMRASGSTWLSDPYNDPWKLKCSNCRIRFPSNDFGAYYNSGLNEEGIFDPKIANPEYLKNTLYPEKGEKWGVEDGYGWVEAAGKKHTFIAYYNHWILWSQAGRGGAIQKALDDLRDAYLYTGDIRYARIGIILLDRIADVYPDMNLAVYADADGYRNSHGGTGQGKILGCIWETFIAQSFIKAYDAFFPAMDDTEVINFLAGKSTRYDMDNPKSTGALIRKNIEDGIIRQIYTAVKNCQIEGNFGMYQATLALAAVVLDSNPETKEWLDFAFQTGGPASDPWRITGGDILATLVNKVDRDGHGNEAAPGYNMIWLNQMIQVADVLDGYEGYQDADLYKNPKFVKMFSAMYPLILCERYTAQIGDSGATGNTGLVDTIENSIKGFMKTGDPVLAQLAYFLNHNSVEGLHGDIFDKNSGSVAHDIQNIISEKGKFSLDSTNLTGYGFTALRDGKNNRQFVGYRIPFASLSAFDSTAGFQLYTNSGTIQFNANEAGNRISFNFNVPRTDTYEVNLNPFKASSYGIYDISIDGEKVKTVDFYGGSGANSNLETLAMMELTEGEHVITFEGVGKNIDAGGFKMGVIHLVLFDEEALKIKNDGGLVDTQRDFWMYYGRNTGHGHRDTLNLGVHAYGLDIAPDLGYPEETGAQPQRLEWVSNTISHNTVVVDEAKQEGHFVGIPLHFDSTDRVKLMDVDASKVYSQTEMYRRTLAMIKVNDEISYGVDFFRVKGGNDHYYSFHGAEGTVVTEGLNLSPQVNGNGEFTGTYAGADTIFGVRPADDSVSGWGYSGPGFHWLKNVEKEINPGNNFSVDWDIVDGRRVLPEEMDIHLRLTMLGEYDDVAIMDGQPPKVHGNPEWLKYIIAHRSGQNLNSTFTAVIEPYKDARYVESISEVPVTANGEAANEDVKAVKVVLKDDRIDYIVNSLDTDTVYRVDGKFDFKGFLGVYSEENGYPIYAYINDGEMIGKVIEGVHDCITGKIVDFTDEMSLNNEITIHTDDDITDVDIDALTGRYIYVENDGVRNASYRIEGIKRWDGRNITLDIGGVTPIRSWVDSYDFSKGYIYDIAEGNDFSIPLSKAVNYNPTGGGGSFIPVPQPQKAKIEGIDVLANEDASSGNIVVKLDNYIVQKAFEKTPNNEDGEKTIKLEVPVSKSEGYEIEIPASVVAGTETGRNIAIKTGTAEVVLPGNMLSGTSYETAASIRLNISKADKAALSEDVRESIGERPVIQLSISVDGQKKEWSNPYAHVKVSIPYIPTAAELKDPEHITVWYIDVNGNAIPVPSGIYNPNTGMVTFFTNHFSSYAVVYEQKSFKDLEKYPWAKKQIEVLASKGIISGTSSTEFSPGSQITRADYLVLLVKTLGLTANFDSNFNDVESGKYYYEAVGIAKALGITSGTGDNRFSPKAAITRQDMMVLTEKALEIVKLLKTKGTADDIEKFTDKQGIAGYAVNSIATLVKDGLIEGSGGRINPRDNTTRAEAAVLLYRIYSKVAANW